MNPRSYAMSDNARSPLWSLDEDKILVDAIKAGASVPAMQRLLPGRTAQSIQNRAARLGRPLSLKPNPVAAVKPQGIDGEIIRLCGYIKSDSSIAAYIGCSRDHVAAMRRRLPPEKPMRSAGQNDLAGDPLPIRADTWAEEASAQLRDRMVKLYADRAHARRETTHFAMLACLYGRESAIRFTTQKGSANV